MRYSLSLVAAISITLAACSKHEPVAIEEASFINDGYEVESVIFEAPVIKKGEDDPETRSTLIPNGESIRFAWETTDTVGIYPDRGSQVFFSMEGGVGTNVANFEGGGWALRQNSTYTSYYPFIGNMYLDREKIPVSFLGQEQNGVSNYDNTRFILASEGTSSEQGTLRFSYEMLNTIIMVNATLPAGNYTKMSLIADEPVFVAEGSFSLDERTIVGSAFTNELGVTLNDLILTEESTIQFYLTEAPVDLRGKEITVRFYTSDGKSYSCLKSPSKAYDAGTWYGLNCVVAEDEVECPTAADDLHTPLTLEAINDGSISIENPLGLTIEYFKNNTWNETDETQITIPVVAGEAISFRGNNEAYASLTRSTHFSTGNCYIYGNIMSLISSNDFTSISSVKARAFYGLFSFTQINNHPQRDLLLPATSLSEDCYSFMFSGSYLTRTPGLPATNLAEGCYSNMFSNCGSLATVSELPAITLSTRCYYYMFQSCQALTVVPNLPATELAEGCYYGMFYNCTALTTAPELPAAYLAENCYNSMFYGCIKLEETPVLPARFLRNGCYSYMFYDCMKINHVEAHFLIKPGTYYTNDWLAGVSSNGSFVKNSSWDLSGDSGVPEGWTIINNGEEVINVFFVDGVDFGQRGSYIDIGEFLSSYYSDISLEDVTDVVLDPGDVKMIWQGKVEQDIKDGMFIVHVAPDTPTKTLDGEVYFAVKDPVRPTRSVLIPKNERGYLMYFNNGRNMPEEFYLVVRAKLQYGSSYINLDPADIVVRSTEGQDVPPALVIETEPGDEPGDEPGTETPTTEPGTETPTTEPTGA